MSEEDRYLSKRASELTANDFNSNIEILITDGSYFNIKNAFTEREGAIHYIFTEHFMHFHVHDDEVIYIKQTT